MNNLYKSNPDRDSFRHISIDFDQRSEYIYLKKNSEPSGNTTRHSDGTSGVPLWYHVISGDGLPAALQFNVNGSSRAATASDGCSRMRGLCWAKIYEKKKITISMDGKGLWKAIILNILSPPNEWGAEILSLDKIEMKKQPLFSTNPINSINLFLAPPQFSIFIVTACNTTICSLSPQCGAKPKRLEWINNNTFAFEVLSNEHSRSEKHFNQMERGNVSESKTVTKR